MPNLVGSDKNDGDTCACLGTPPRAPSHSMAPMPYLWNGWSQKLQIWYMDSSWQVPSHGRQNVPKRGVDRGQIFKFKTLCDPVILIFWPENHIIHRLSQGHSLYQAGTFWDHSFLSNRMDRQIESETDTDYSCNYARYCHYLNEWHEMEWGLIQ